MLPLNRPDSPPCLLMTLLKCLLSCVSLSALLVSGTVAAQSLDLSGATAATVGPAAADALRAADADELRAGSGGTAATDVPEHAAADLHDASRPYGENLFTGGFSNDREDGLNPAYVMQPGDRVSIRIWGATEFNESLTIDPQGNVFLPSVGPIKLAGVRNDALNDHVKRAVATVFTDNVRVYTSLDGSQPVAVFVTGSVANPGRFAGIPSNSVLYFIDRAGGIDARRGSYRSVRILRDGVLLADIDLYDFLHLGRLESVQFRDGDTILVGARGSTVSVTGDVANPANFELAGVTATGADIVALARLQPGVTHVGLSGIRSGATSSVYVPLTEFVGLSLHDGDVVTFRSDQQEQIIVVEIEGSYLGPSRYAVPRDARLQELLDLVAVDPLLADVSAISIRRSGIALRQKEALRESLQRLEARYLTASSQTDKESSIRAQEAQLIGQFVKNARKVEPSGRLVVARNDRVADIRLQAGDVVTIPAKSESVLLSGEVLISQAMLAEEGWRARDYIARSGGFSQQALEKRLIVIHANGEVSSGSNPNVRAGDEVIVLPRVPVKNLQIAATIVDILYKVAVAAAVAIQL